MSENYENQGPKYLYSADEKEELLEYIEETFGEVGAMGAEKVSPDIELNLLIIKPTEDFPYLTLVTYGAGAYKMNVPEELADQELEYAEYVMLLPGDWNLETPDENSYWPVKLIKDCARLPIWTDSWMGPGHTTECEEDEESYAPDVEFNGALIKLAADHTDELSIVTLSSGRTVNFYLVVPLFPEELSCAMEDGTKALLDIFDEFELPYMVTDPERPRLNDIIAAAEEAGLFDEDDEDEDEDYEDDEDEEDSSENNVLQ